MSKNFPPNLKAQCKTCGTIRKSSFHFIEGNVRMTVLRCANCGELTNHRILAEVSDPVANGLDRPVNTV